MELNQQKVVVTTLKQGAAHYGNNTVDLKRAVGRKLQLNPSQVGELMFFVFGTGDGHGPSNGQGSSRLDLSSPLGIFGEEQGQPVMSVMSVLASPSHQPREPPQQLTKEEYDNLSEAQQKRYVQVHRQYHQYQQMLRQQQESGQMQTQEAQEHMQARDALLRRQRELQQAVQREPPLRKKPVVPTIFKPVAHSAPQLHGINQWLSLGFSTRQGDSSNI
jgi:hypothetical protein